MVRNTDAEEEGRPVSQGNVVGEIIDLSDSQDETAATGIPVPRKGDLQHSQILSHHSI